FPRPMTDSQTNATLNDLLILIYRSLLQYAVECWPWSDPADEAEHDVIERLASEQKSGVARLATFLDQRQHPIDFGTYPDWSALHYVSLDSMLGQLIGDEAAIIAGAERALPTLKADPEASGL